MVDAAGVGGGGGWAAQREVPFEEVGVEEVRVVVGGGVGGEFAGFFDWLGGGVLVGEAGKREGGVRGVRMRLMVGDFVLNWGCAVIVRMALV